MNDSFEVILEVNLKITVVRYVTPCGLVQTKVSEESGTSINPVFNWEPPWNFKELFIE
jgi:hypothetical protein